MTQSTDYTAHVQLPDGVVGSMFHETVMTFDTVTFSALRVGSSTWLSFGVHAETDDTATMLVSSIMYAASRITPHSARIPEGYDENLPSLFETAPLVICAGRTVIHSERI